jgi:hypothetical protein
VKLLVNSFSVDKRLLPISYFARAIYQTKILFKEKITCLGKEKMMGKKRRVMKMKENEINK